MVIPKSHHSLQDHCSHLREYADFIVSLVDRCGPTPGDDADVHRVVNQVERDLRAGRLTMKDIHFLRGQFGYTLSTRDTLQGHALAKPYGYPGDFELFDKIYTRHVSDQANLQRWDQFFHRLDASEAVRNRKAWLLDQLAEKQADRNRPLHVLIVGSGPGREVLEFLQRGTDLARFDCVELDPRAIQYARRLCEPVAEQICFIQGSILRFKTETRYDLIWSGGLFDYFNDRVFGRGLAHLLNLAGQGGEVIIGNFATPNSSQAFMELVTDWKLTLRTPSELRRLARQTGIDEKRVRIDSEPSGVNLFLRISR